MKSLVIVGAGGFGRETAALVESINAQAPTWDLLGFVDDASSLHGESVQDLPILGSLSWLKHQQDVHYVIAIGDPSTRRSLAQSLQEAEASPATLLHPSAALHRSCETAPGMIACRNTTGTVSVDVGQHAILNLHSTLGHDVRVGDYVTLHPGVHLSGNACIEDEVELGTGAVVLPSVTIEQGVTVGAGAVVNRDLPPNCTAVGVPARPI